MSKKFKAYINSLRLRTLPLSLAGVLLGTCLAIAYMGRCDWPTVIFLFLTTVCLQILSNLSNELGDTLNGTDTEARQGPQYSLGSGNMTIGEMKNLIRIFAGLCVIFGLLMIWFAGLGWGKSLCLIVLGTAAIWGATHYTMGKNPYGYRGLGDISVFIFFGIVSVLGAYFVLAGTIDRAALILPAVSIGCFSVGVLNVNNIRDMKTDAQTRVTVALRLGLRKARIYQTLLIAVGWAGLIAFVIIDGFHPLKLIFLAALPLHIIHLKGIWTKTDRELDPMLPLLVMSTFILSLLLGVACLLV